MRTPALALSLMALIGTVACGTPPPKTPDPAPTQPPTDTPTIEQEVGNAFKVEGPLTSEKLPAALPSFAVVDRDLPPVPAGLPKAPARCDAFAKTKAEAMECSSRDAALTSLTAALTSTDVAARDAKLAGLETCAEIPAGLARALRAELAPTECADVIVASMANSPPAGIRGEIHDTLLGLGLAGMLSRAANDPPKMKGKPTKKAVKAFINGEMYPWVKRQAQAIEKLSGMGSKLRYYGKAVVAVEAGMADMRFVDAVRSVPVPEEFASDVDLRETFLQGLEDALEPRKRRGRDAALVGLGSLATVGVLRDPRVDRARKLLSRMFGGRPINALDALLLPPLRPVDAATPAHKLAARLQTFYASLVIPAEAATDASMLRMLIEKGLSLPHRIALNNGGSGLSKEVRLHAARARLELGQNYWRRVDFDEATKLLTEMPKGTVLDEDGKLILAVALALRGGHQNAAHMMVKGPMSDLSIGNVTALDTMTEDGGVHAGHATFDAALIKKLAAPGNAPASLWTNLGQRFRKAEGMLEDVRHKDVARGFAEEAEQTAAAVEKMRK